MYVSRSCDEVRQGASAVSVSHVYSVTGLDDVGTRIETWRWRGERRNPHWRGSDHSTALAALRVGG